MPFFRKRKNTIDGLGNVDGILTKRPSNQWLGFKRFIIKNDKAPNAGTGGESTKILLLFDI